jgi:hypothetical protein
MKEIHFFLNQINHLQGSSSSARGKLLNKISANSVFSNKHFNVDVGKFVVELNILRVLLNGKKTNDANLLVFLLMKSNECDRRKNEKENLFCP